MPDLIFHNAQVYAPGMAADALAVRDGKILATGKFSELKNLAHAKTQLLDLQGKMLLPGFFDAHVHVWKVGDLRTFNLDLRGAASIAEIQEKLRDFSLRFPEQPWLRARGFNEALLRENRLPTRADLDRVVPDRPVFLQRTCAHIAVLNSAALTRCGIDARTPVPFGGEIRLGPDGQPNGVLCETALGLAMRHFPPVTEADYETMILAACRELLRHGVTAATDPAVMPDLLAVYRRLDREGRLPLRLHAVPIVLPDGGDEPLPLPEPYASEKLVVNTVKFFADGGLSGQTAALSRPYKNAGHRGILRLRGEQYFQLALAAQEKGFQVATHAIGDEAIGFVLDTYERLYARAPSAPRHRIEHLGLPTADHIGRIAGMGLHVVTQPIFLQELGQNFQQALDDDFLNNCYPVRALLDRGVNVAFSTDAPVVRNLSPMAGISSALLRRAADGAVIAPQEAVSLDAALRCYTENAARANRCFEKTGSLEAGKSADLVVLERSPFAVRAEELADIRVAGVWAGGLGEPNSI